MARVAAVQAITPLQVLPGQAQLTHDLIPRSHPRLALQGKPPGLAGDRGREVQFLYRKSMELQGNREARAAIILG